MRDMLIRLSLHKHVHYATKNVSVVRWLYKEVLKSRGENFLLKSHHVTLHWICLSSTDEIVLGKKHKNK